MRAPGSLALRTVCALFLLLHSVEGSNSTAPDTTPKYTGWQKGPAERGTMTILWSCLTTVFACTWTILHLNVPNLGDGTWTKILRKIKWMTVTVIFPEFIFAKAVCELQMAVEDLHDLKKQEEPFGWTVEYGWGCRLLYRLYHPNAPIQTIRHLLSALRLKVYHLFRSRSGSYEMSTLQPSSSTIASEADVPRNTWTLTHCYFANMGGIVGEPSWMHPNALLTAHALVKCCVPNKHSPLDDFRLSKEEISDKSKADNLLKAAAALQILWLVVSVITRKAYDLPISLLEVCTVAFAALSVATYVANLAKPKDVEVPVILYDKDVHQENNDLYDLCGHSFFARTIIPTEPHGPPHYKPRITNDMLRLQSHGTQHVTLIYALAVSTMCFGAIHCAAWQSHFPSQVEKRLWQVSSVLSSTLPLSNLLALITCKLVLGRKADKVINTMKSLMKSPMEGTSGTNHKCDRRTNLIRVKFAWIDGYLWVDKKDTTFGEFLQKSILALLEVANGVGKGEASRSWCTKYLLHWGSLNPSRLHWGLLGPDQPDAVYELVETPEELSNFNPLNKFASIKRSNLSEDIIPLALEIINDPHGITKKFETQWNLLEKWMVFVSIVFACLTGILYATARLILLAVAFAAFRKQDEKLYVDTWARFMLSWT